MQVIRIYRKRGGLAFTFRPFFASAEAMAKIADEYPENDGYSWLR